MPLNLFIVLEKGGQGDGGNPEWCELSLSKVVTKTKKEEVQTGALLVQKRARDGLPRDPCVSRTASVIGVSGTLPVSWVRRPHLPETNTSLGRCWSCFLMGVDSLTVFSNSAIGRIAGRARRVCLLFRRGVEGSLGIPLRGRPVGRNFVGRGGRGRETITLPQGRGCPVRRH